MAKAKHWSKMTDEEIVKLQRESWPLDDSDDPLIRSVCESMRGMTTDEYRDFLEKAGNDG